MFLLASKICWCPSWRTAGAAKIPEDGGGTPRWSASVSPSTAGHQKPTMTWRTAGWWSCPVNACLDSTRMLLTSNQASLKTTWFGWGVRQDDDRCHPLAWEGAFCWMKWQYRRIYRHVQNYDVHLYILCTHLYSMYIFFPSHMQTHWFVQLRGGLDDTWGGAMVISRKK